MPDPAYRNLLGACVFSALLFGIMLRLASRGAGSPTLWLELAFGLANLVATNWVVFRLYRQVRSLQTAQPSRPPAA